jgi:VCBS repeat-containing protein
MQLRKSFIILSAATALGACGSSSDSNEAPIFSSTNYAFEVNEDSNMSGSVSATDDGSVTFTIASAANNGALTLNADGTFIYTPNADFSGQDSAQVQASDGSLSSNATLNFIINNVNDDPVLTGSEITLSTGVQSSGQISVSDVDGDAITFTLISQPDNGTIVLDTGTGAFTYSTTSLTAIDGNFDITFTDGNIAAPIEANINLSPAYTTNADKLNFYYASVFSHLKQAEAIKGSVADDTLVNEINLELGLAYSIAGFDSLAQNLFDEITTLDAQSDAFDEAAEVQQALGNIALASQFRSKSELLYTQFVAEKGITNMRSGDFGVFLGMVRDYLSAGELDAANSLLVNLKVFASAFIEEEYNSSFGFALTSFRTYAQDASDEYFANKTDENRQIALDAINNLAGLVKQIGFWTDRRTDQLTERQRVLRATWVSELYFNLGAIEEAKDYTNFTLSLYGIPSVDPAYVYEASPYAEATLATYQFSLSSLAGLIEGLYPEVETNPALALITSSRDLADAQVSILSKRLANNIAGGMDIEVAIMPIFDYFLANNDYLRLYEALVENFVAEPAGALLLNVSGNTEHAIALLNRSIELLTSEAYIDGILADRGQMSTIMGRKGCARAIDIMNNFGGDPKPIAAACETAVSTYLTTEAGKVTTSLAIQAHRNLLQIQHKVDDLEGIKITALNYIAEIERLTDLEDKADELMLAANYLLRYGAVEQAQSFLFSGFDTLKMAVETDETGELLEDAIEMIEERVFRMRVFKDGMSETGFSEQESFIRGLAFKSGRVNDYATYYETTLARAKAEAAYYTQALLDRSINEQLNNIEDIIVINAAVGNEQVVTDLINNENLSAADTLDFTALYAQIVASRNDFEGTNVASVDTDNDGLPNFFIASASADDISASGLVADNDADNDGINDADDPNPLN